VRLGRPPTVPQSVVRRIVRQRARGDSLRAIADALNDDAVPAAQGGAQWYAATVRGILGRTSELLCPRKGVGGRPHPRKPDRGGALLPEEDGLSRAPARIVYRSKSILKRWVFWPLCVIRSKEYFRGEAVEAAGESRLLPVNAERGHFMSTDQKRARWFGVLFLITFATSIPALLLFQPVLDDPIGYIAGGGHDKRILFGAFLELLLIISNIGTAVVIVPIMWRRYKDLSIGYVTARLFECTFILVGIVSVLGIITLRNQAAGASEGTVAYTLAALKDWTFLLGPGWVVPWGNGLILGYMMYRSQLVPRPWPWLGMIGGPLLLLTSTLILFGGNQPSSGLHSLQGLVTIPEAAWELFLGVYCTIWGFRKEAPILGEADEPESVSAAAALSPA
jgi:hypothetical protein